ncbi:MAG: SMC-Scp complex subunit ScpB [Planctomycetota bacterium]
MLRRTNEVAAALGSTAARYAAPLARWTRYDRQRNAYLLTVVDSGSRRVDGRSDRAYDSDSAKLARLEAILFLAREPLSSRKLADLADLADGTEARSLVGRLSEQLSDHRSALQPVEVAGGFQLLTRPQASDWLSRLHGHSDAESLSNPAMETLSIVAYRQPIGRAEIESIRGVQCGELLRLLMQRDLLRIVGRSEDLGRPFLYGVTRRFLQVFGLRRLEELPRIDDTRGDLADPESDHLETGQLQHADDEFVKE